jgi:FkbM family methyltransferase
VTNWLRACRAAVSTLIGGLLAAVPALEPSFIAAGRWLDRRSHRLGTLYWFANEDLQRRLRASPRRFRSLRVAGVEMLVDITDGTGRMHYFYDQPYEPDLATAIAAALGPGDVFVDVGANVGFFSVLAGRLIGATGRVVAFEPHPQAMVRLQEAIAVNGLSDRIEVVEAALGAAEGTTRLFLSDDSVLSTTDPARSPVRDQFTFPASVDVRLTTLDGWIAGRADLLPRLRAIKIDVEGTEDETIEGMRATLWACPRAAVVCETTAASPADVALRNAGYQASVLDVREGLFGNYLYVRPPALRAATPDAP